MQSAHHGASWALQDVANLVVRQRLDLAQENHRAMFGRQLLEGFLEAASELGLAGSAIRIALTARHPLELVFRILTPQHIVTTLATPEIDRKVGSDAIQPSRE